MEAKAFVSIGPRTRKPSSSVGDYKNPNIGTHILASHEFKSNTSSYVGNNLSNQNHIASFGSLSLNNASKSPTVSIAPSAKTSRPQIKVYESAHAAIWSSTSQNDVHAGPNSSHYRSSSQTLDPGTSLNRSPLCSSPSSDTRGTTPNSITSSPYSSCSPSTDGLPTPRTYLSRSVSSNSRPRRKKGNGRQTSEPGDLDFQIQMSPFSLEPSPQVEVLGEGFDLPPMFSSLSRNASHGSITHLNLSNTRSILPDNSGDSDTETSELEKLPDIGDSSEIDAPDRVVATYTEDLNIIKIHEAIMTIFAHKYSQVSIIEAKLQWERQNATTNMTINEHRRHTEDIQHYETKLQELQDRTSFKEYLQMSVPLLKVYKSVSSDASKGIVSVRKLINKESTDDPNVIIKRLAVIQEYLEVARNYITLDVVQTNQIRAKCPGCGVDFSQVDIDEENGLCTCECGVVRENLSLYTLYKDSNRVNIGNRNNYEDWENFEKALIRYQGKQPNKPPDRLYDQLDAYYTKIQKSRGSDVQAQALLADGKKTGTSRQMMLDALCETANSAYYDDVNLIMHVYWGWRLPDVSHLEDQIMKDYFSTQQIYNSQPHEGRDASLNTQFRLYVHLLAVGHECSRDDFKIQTSRDSLEFHQDMWRRMCEKTGVRFYPVI